MKLRMKWNKGYGAWWNSATNSSWYFGYIRQDYTHKTPIEFVRWWIKTKGKK